jgi:type IV pilus assembly protein PilY1
MFNTTHDIDLDYQDDVIYVPYVKQCDTTSAVCEAGTWTDGGVLRVQTRENPVPSTANWPVTTVIEGTGPVTSSVAKLQNVKTNDMWLYFGTGRYFYEKYGSSDDGVLRRTIFGIKDPCFKADGSGFEASCPSAISFCSNPVTATECGGLKNADDVTVANSFDPAVIDGWYINLEEANNYAYLEGKPATSVTRSYRTERVITDPLAVSTGVVYFTTYKPYDGDPCRIGGKTFIWAVKYDTGGDPSTLLKGKALVQVSTGSIEQIDLATAFTEKGKRRSSAMEGVPPTAQGLSVLSSPAPVKRVVHIKER